MWLSLALTTQAAMIGCLFFSWRLENANKVLLRSTALVACIASLLCWQLVAGWEFGSSFFFMALSLLAWGLIIYSSPKSPKGKTAKEKTFNEKKLSFNWAKIGYFVLQFLFYVLILGIISALASIAIAYDLPLKETTQIAIATFLYPCLWATLALFCLVSRKRWPTAALLIGLSSYAIFRLYL